MLSIFPHRGHRAPFYRRMNRRAGEVALYQSKIQALTHPLSTWCRMGATRPKVCYAAIEGGCVKPRIGLGKSHTVVHNRSDNTGFVNFTHGSRYGSSNVGSYWPTVNSTRGSAIEAREHPFQFSKQAAGAAPARSAANRYFSCFPSACFVCGG